MNTKCVLNITLGLCLLALIACGEETDSEPTPNDTSTSTSQNAGPANVDEMGNEQTPETAPEAQTPAEQDMVEPNDNEAPTEEGNAGTQNIAEILETDPRFSKVLELVNLIGLLDVMRSPGPFTIFIPTNAAIDALPGDLMQRVRDEQDYLHKFILAHVAEGDLPSAGLMIGEAVEMIGGAVSIGADVDGGLAIGGAQVIEADLPAANGRLHVLGGVIPIPETPATE